MEAMLKKVLVRKQIFGGSGWVVEMLGRVWVSEVEAVLENSREIMENWE